MDEHTKKLCDLYDYERDRVEYYVLFYWDQDANTYRQNVFDSVRRILKSYRSAVLHSRKRGHTKPHFASLDEYRPEFIKSYLAFRAFLTLCDEYGK